MKYKTLVNKNNLIKEKFLDKINLITVKDINNKEIKVEEETYKNYLELKKYFASKNINLGIESAFRSKEKQQEVYDEFIQTYGKDYADKYVAPVGTSEHHTGLAIDLEIKIGDHYIDSNVEYNKYIDVYKEIHSKLSEFGFILRYPENKEDITGYPYEPWHIRYVGKFVSKIIYENNYTLEEYLSDFSGVIIVNKEQGVTSFDVVNDIIHLFGIKRVGHTGTLDPLAEGVLIVAIGKATKVVELLTSTYKEYVSKVKMGIKTDTYDITGNILAETKEYDLSNIEEVLTSFKKTYNQEVPIYSAVKVNGKKLYEYARNNKQVELPKKEVTIKEIELLEKTNDTFTFKTTVSKGCYIRSLINDIAMQMNTYATMETLLRTKQGKISIENSSTIEEIRNNNYKLYNIDDVLDIPVVVLDNDLAKKVSFGQHLNNEWNIKDKVIFKNENNKILGIYEVFEQQLKVWKNF